MFVEVKALQGLCYLLYVYSTQNKSSMSMSAVLLGIVRSTYTKADIDRKINLEREKTAYSLMGVGPLASWVRCGA